MWDMCKKESMVERDVHMRGSLLFAMLKGGIEPPVTDWTGCHRNVESCVSSTSDFRFLSRWSDGIG